VLRCPIKSWLVVGCANWFIIILFSLSIFPQQLFLLKKCYRISLSSHLLSTLTPIITFFLTTKPRPSGPSPRHQNQEESRFARAKFCTSKLPYSDHISLLRNPNHAPFEALDSWQKGAIILKNLKVRKQRKSELFHR